MCASLLRVWNGLEKTRRLSGVRPLSYRTSSYQSQCDDDTDHCEGSERASEMHRFRAVYCLGERERAPKYEFRTTTPRILPYVREATFRLVYCTLR